MAESLLQDPNLSAFVIPPMDSSFLTASDSNPADLEFTLDDNCDFHLTFDDIDGIDFPFESEPFLTSNTPGCFDNTAQESGSSGMSADVDGYLNSSFQEASSQGSGVSDSSNYTMDEKVKVEETGKSCPAKRKKDFEDTNTSRLRSDDSPAGEEEEKRKARLMRNRESAQLSRQRKKQYVEELEEKVRNMHSTITDLNQKVAFFMAENATLRQQLNSGSAAGMCPAPPMYPQMPYLWSCASYIGRPHASQVPLVPIPRLKPQQTVSASKAKKTENKKSGAKTKKVASISFLGLMFFMLLFGGLVPLFNVKYVGTGYNNKAQDSVGDGFYSTYKGRIWRVSGHTNTTETEFSDGTINISQHAINCMGGCVGEPGHSVEEKGRETYIHNSEKSLPLGNSSEPLVAALYVPRNDKLVKIDGNLIIHSVIASEKAMASKEAHKKRNERESGLATPTEFSQALAIPDSRVNRGQDSHTYREPAERHKALPGSADALKDHFKSSAADGKMQQWFQEGVAGPMLSSGICSEVFQFDVSPSSAHGAIFPTSFISNTSGEHRQNDTEVRRGRNRNDTEVRRGRNRRALHGIPVPVPLPGSNLNVTAQQARRNSSKEAFPGTKAASSMVVSVLVDPREAGDGDIDGMIRPKSLSRIFVVVLLDSVKYVTYSCALPMSVPHLVAS